MKAEYPPPLQPVLVHRPRSPLRRPPTQWLPEPPGLQQRILLPALREIDLGFAGRRNPGDAVHRRLATLQVGTALRLVREGGEHCLLTLDGHAVGRLPQRHFTPPEGLRCIEARVRAIIIWRRRDTPAEYLERCRCEHWEVVLPELLFAP